MAKNLKVTFHVFYIELIVLVPDVCEELILLEHTDVERGLYREAQASGDQLRLRQLCCHIQTSDKDRGVRIYTMP